MEAFVFLGCRGAPKELGAKASGADTGSFACKSGVDGVMVFGSTKVMANKLRVTMMGRVPSKSTLGSWFIKG